MNSFKFILKYSYRNLWRNPKRTIILVLSLSLGTGFIIWDLNFANSGSKEVMKEFLSQYAGEYQLTHKDYYDSSNKKEFNNFKTISDEKIKKEFPLFKREDFDFSTKRVTAPVFISGQKKTMGLLLTGIEITKELSLTTLSQAITRGRFLATDSNREIIIGYRLARKIGAKTGDEVAIIGQALDGSVANDLFRVVGLLDFGGGDLEESLAFTSLRSAQEFLSLSPDSYHQRVDFNMKKDTIISTPPNSSLRITKWDEILPEVGVSVRFIDNFTWIVSIIIVIVISLGLSNSLMITFLEREKEFHTLNILGAKESWIAISLMIEIILLGLIAVIFGVVLGHAATYLSFIFPINIEMFTGGKPILMGGMTIKPLVRLYPVAEYYYKVPLMIFFFLSLTMIYPLLKVLKRSRYEI